METPSCDPGECSDTDALCHCLHRFIGWSHSLRFDAGGQRVPHHDQGGHRGSNWEASPDVVVMCNRYIYILMYNIIYIYIFTFKYIYICITLSSLVCALCCSERLNFTSQFFIFERDKVLFLQRLALGTQPLTLLKTVVKVVTDSDSRLILRVIPTGWYLLPVFEVWFCSAPHWGFDSS